MKQLYGWILAILLLQACSGSDYLHETKTDFDDECWAMQDTLELNFENSDTQQVHQLNFPIYVTTDYTYNNLWLRAIVHAPSGEQNVLPAQFVLMERDGTWKNEPSGDEVWFELKIADGLRFNQTGNYRIQLFHFMRDQRLCGIREVGIGLRALQ